MTQIILNDVEITLLLLCHLYSFIEFFLRDFHKKSLNIYECPVRVHSLKGHVLTNIIRGKGKELCCVT